MKSVVFVRSDIKRMEISLEFEDNRVMFMDLKAAIEFRMLLSKKICKLQKVLELRKEE